LKTTRRFSVITLSIVLTMALFISACSKKANNEPSQNASPSQSSSQETSPSNDADEVSNKPITMTMMGFKHPIQGPWENMIFFKEMEQRTNIKFTFDTPPAEGFQEKKNLAFASGEVPDIFLGALLTPGEEVKYGSQGVLIPLEELIEKHAPNIKAMLEEMPDVKKSITAPDGHIYSLPTINKASIAVTPTMWVNGEWMTNLNITSLPQTTEELYTLLKQFKDHDANNNGKPDEIPLGSSSKAADFRFGIMPAFGILSREAVVDDAGKISFGALSDNYKAYLQFMNRLWTDKLMDPDTFTKGFTEMVAKGKADQLGMFPGAAPILVFKGDKTEDNLKHPVLPPLTSPQNSKKMVPIGSGIARGAFAITSKNPDPVRSIQWADYLYSLEGSIFIHYGPEGNLWEYADKEKGVRRYIQHDGMNSEEYRGSLTPDVGTPTSKWVRSEVEQGWDDVGHQYRFKETEEKLFPYGKEPFPQVYFTFEEQNRLDTITTDLITYLDSMEAKFIIGKESFDNWSKYTDTIKSMNIEKYISIYQDAYDRWKAAK